MTDDNAAKLTDLQKEVDNLREEVGNLLDEIKDLRDDNETLRAECEALCRKTISVKRVAEAVNCIRDIDTRTARRTLAEVIPEIPWVVNRRGLIEICHASESEYGFSG